MLIAARISRDIKALWQQRPPMMDHAVAGRLGPLLSPRLAETITRMMRLAHANFFTSFFHLHRVAYKSECDPNIMSDDDAKLSTLALPRTTDVLNAMSEIRKVTRLILESPCTPSPHEIPTVNTPSHSTGSVSSLPVNMLWPLMMLGVETEDLDKRVWVI
jgi:hypothetical protein